MGAAAVLGERVSNEVAGTGPRFTREPDEVNLGQAAGQPFVARVGARRHRHEVRG
jgi:hypothetical protein